jgi:ATP-dependent RNA helicase RhlE
VRTRTLDQFKSGSLQVLVATDIAARGIDISELGHVVNFELPNVPEDYVHRIGRTGRAGEAGEAVSLVCVDEHKLLTDIEKLLKQQLPKEVVAGFESDSHKSPASSQNGYQRGQMPSREQQTINSTTEPSAHPVVKLKAASAKDGGNKSGLRRRSARMT